MKAIDNVIQGITSPLNHRAGSWTNGVYPSGGTQWNRNVSCQRLWVIRLASSPTQNTGIEIPTRARIMRIGSTRLPLNTAAASPIKIDTTTQMTAAPNASERVAGAACTTSGTILWPWFEYETRSRVMKDRKS